MSQGFAIPFEALLGVAARGESEQRDRRGIPEAQVERLREAAALYRAPNPFVAGDFVTPRAGTNLREAGQPHIVLEVIEPVMPSFRTDACCAEKRFDMRVAWLARDGNLLSHWFESFQFERWPLGTTLVSDAPDPSPEHPAAAADAA